METKLSKAEMLIELKALKATELGTQVGQKAKPVAQITVTQEFRETSSLDEIAIARAEMVRCRRRLGTLTHEQEVAIEKLLLSTTIRISELVRRALELHPLTQ
jgi:hypothetical protein